MRQINTARLRTVWGSHMSMGLAHAHPIYYVQWLVLWAENDSDKIAFVGILHSDWLHFWCYQFCYSPIYFFALALL